MPRVFVIAGPNGVGKTAYAREFLPQGGNGCHFVNADLIAAAQSPSAPGRAAFAAGRLMHWRLRELAARRENFAFETTLSGKTYAPFLFALRKAGYRIDLDFLWVPDLETTKERVRTRVQKGGHPISEDVQSRRHHVGLRNLAAIYRPLVHHWRLYDNSAISARLIAEEDNGRLTVINPALLAAIERSANIRFVPETPPLQVEEPIHAHYGSETPASLRAMRRAFARAVLEDLSYGLPVAQWSWARGEMVRVPSELLAPLARRILEVDGEALPEAEERELLSGAPQI